MPSKKQLENGTRVSFKVNASEIHTALKSKGTVRGVSLNKEENQYYYIVEADQVHNCETFFNVAESLVKVIDDNYTDMVYTFSIRVCAKGKRNPNSDTKEIRHALEGLKLKSKGLTVSPYYVWHNEARKATGPELDEF